VVAAALVATLPPAVARAQPAVPCDGGAFVGFVYLAGRPIPGHEIAVSPGTALSFRVQGGTCPLVLRIVTNASGASFDPVTGAYQAGASAPPGGSADVVWASDATGQVAAWTILVTVGGYDWHDHGEDGTEVAVGCGGSSGNASWLVVVSLVGAGARRRRERIGARNGHHARGGALDGGS
jgi:hypothetical protein